jgi:glycerophosphoryl diester phosphodiesterase
VKILHTISRRIHTRVSLSYLVLTLIAINLICCNVENTAIVPRVTPLPVGAVDVPFIAQVPMEGVYEVVSGKERFGEVVALRWRYRKLTIFAKDNYLILRSGLKDSSIYLQGFWRVPTSDGNGTANFVIEKTQGTRTLLRGFRPPSFSIKGKFGSGNEAPQQNFELKFVRPFSGTVTGKDFQIVGHRAGGRTSDRLPVSENSIEMISFTENYGSTGIEIDVRLTRDKVPVLYHDEDINIRLTVKGPINGPIGNFTYDQLNTFVRLIRGERIPKLLDALNYVVDSTRLEFVWLDMKEGGQALDLVIPIQDQVLKRARQKNRKLEVLIGIPTDDVLNDFKAIRNFSSIPSLCEISPEEARNLNSLAWAPRWTLGTQNDLVAEVQSEGRQVYCWTIDVPSYIDAFIRDGRFDGLLTNYPSIVAYYYYTQP